MRCFEILRQYNAETEQTELASVICLLELKHMEEAKEKCEQLLETGAVLFGDILETYVTILVQTNDYEGVIETVEKVLQTKDIMPEQKEKLAQLALFAEGMLNEVDTSLVDSNFELDEFTNEMFGKLWAKAKSDSATFVKRLRSCITCFKEIFSRRKQHPYLKTSILYKMIENQIEEEIEVEKFGNTIKVIPAFTGHNEEQSDNIIHTLSSRLEQNYPDIFDAMVTYWKELQISVFPFALLMDKVEIWAAVLERIGRKRFGLTIDEEELMTAYNIELEEFHIAYQWLLRIEREGYLPV